MKRLLAPMAILALVGVLAVEIPARGLTASPATTQPAATQTTLSTAAATAPRTTSVPPTTATAGIGGSPATAPLALTTRPTTATLALTTRPTTAPLALGTRPTTGAASLIASGPELTQTAPAAPTYSYHSRRSRFNEPRSRAPDAAPAQASGPNILPRPITRDYYPVLTRSIFLKGRQNIYSDPFSESVHPRYVAAQTRSSTEPATTAPDDSSSPESIMVFNGASDVDGRLTAFIENTGLNVVTRVHPGEAVAQGKIVRLTLDSLDYAVGAQITHVLIGQNLLGVDVTVLTTQPVASTSQPTGTDSSGAQQSILERLRRRRLEELGQ